MSVWEPKVRFVKLGLEKETKGFLLFEIEVIVNKEDNRLTLDTDVLQFLKPRAVEMYCSDTGSPILPKDWEAYTVDFKCYDNDGDLIVVRSNQDFRILFSQSSNDHCLKVLASVTPPSVEPPADSATCKSTQTQEKCEAKVDDDQAKGKSATLADEKEDQKIIGAIAELFTIAALSMKAGVSAVTYQENLKASSSSKEQIENIKKASQSSLKAARKVSKESLKIAKKISKDSFKQVFHALKTVDCAIPESHSPPADDTTKSAEPTDVGSGKAAPVLQKEVPAEISSPSAPNDTAKPTEPSDAGSGNAVPILEKEVPAEFTSPSAPVSETPFIHGRHTCDQCLTTPIIGKRFHALNLPDYDLCEVCFGNYKGTDIVFEEVRLERDTPFQERWNRRRAMHEASMKRRVRLHSRRSCNRHKNRDCVRSASEPCVQKQDASVNMATLPETPTVTSELSKDPFLEEAIRRSLDDLVQTKHVAETEVDSQDDAGKVVVDVAKSDGLEENSSSLENLIDTVEAEIVLDADVAPFTDTPQKESSFASEAIGSGEVAAFVGETLDRLIEAIEDLSSEVDKGDLVYASHTSHFDDESDALGIESFESGSKIVDGEEDAASTGSWSVVAEKEQAAILDDEGLGRAAEAIGSALFQSDMMRSTEDATLSPVASVPTHVPSIMITDHDIPQAQLDRWAYQLGQLRELGFSDDAVSIDALEALSAANIGVDSDEEVTVQQVIEKLMSD